MSKLNIDQRTIANLLTDKKSDFLIPDYQRPYEWGEDECSTLWDDLFTFAFPDNNCENFDAENDEYFLGPIVTFRNEDGKLEVIDGQQRLTTIMLLLRVFYSRFESARDRNTVATRDLIAKCLWKTDEFGNPETDCLKINSEVASDDDKEEFLDILKNGNPSGAMKSRYAAMYRYFMGAVEKFIDSYPMYTALLPTRILNNVILLPIEAETQDTALRIFSTLNDRGLPLSDADIFKSQFYKYYSGKGERAAFIERWKGLEEIANANFKPLRGTPMDELFTRYMYFERARRGIKDTTTQSLRSFYEKDHYALLRKPETLDGLEELARFWERVMDQDDSFSERALTLLYILNNAPNGMWTYLTSVYFLANRHEDGSLDDGAFCDFLSKITAFIWAYAVDRPGVNALRTPVYPEMINLVQGRPVTFADHRFDRTEIRNKLGSYAYTNQRPFTKSMIAWWAFQNPDQGLLDLSQTYEIEHIYSKNRFKNERSLANGANLEALGNKALLEKKINIRASDYQFRDKAKYYEGFIDAKGNVKQPTRIAELRELAREHDDFTERDIEKRTDEILDALVEYLDANGLLLD